MRQWFLLSLCAFAASLSVTAGAAQHPDKVFEAPEVVLLDSLRTMFEGVQFDHGLHDSYAACVECHHHLTGKPPSDPNCKVCHQTGTSKSSIDCKSCHLIDRFSPKSLSNRNNQPGFHIDIAGLKGVYHLKCLGCHLSLTAGPTGCRDCHQSQDGRSSLLTDRTPTEVLQTDN